MNIESNSFLESYLTAAVASDYNYLLAAVVIMGCSMILVVFPLVFGEYLGWRKPPKWSVLLVTSISGILFVFIVAILLKTPGVYYDHHEDIFKLKYIGTPDDTAGYCPVYITNGESYKEIPLFDENKKPIMYKTYDENNKVIMDSDGNPVMKQVMTKVKVEYMLHNRPFGPKMGFPRIYLLISNKIYREPHLCALDPNENNYAFMKKTQEKWDEVNGTEPEKKSEKKDGEEGKEEGQSQKGDPNGEADGEPSNSEPQEGDPSSGKPAPPIVITLPDQGDDEAQSENRGPKSDAEKENDRKMKQGTAKVKKSKKGGDAEDGQGTDEAEDQDSQGSIKVSPGIGMPVK